jgi:Chitobiase/beta-hexosaminidase C-terminal domain/Concanavalin A-like lectin/glucanases superfamily
MPTLHSLSWRRHFLVLRLTLLFFAVSVSLAWSASGTGLVGFWNFDEAAGLIANDYSGNNNTGVLVNQPQWTTGRFGAGLSFDGIDDYVEVVHSDRLNRTRELTVSAWIYNKATHEPSLQQSEYHIIAAKGWAADIGGSWTLGWDRKTNSLFFCARKNTDKGVVCASFDFGSLTDDWHLITAVFNDGIIRLYVDGLLAAGPVNLGTARINNNTENLHIGGLPSSAGNSNDTWHGFIDEVQISNDAFNNTEVATISGVGGSKQHFDFSLIRPGDVSVAQGSAASTSINTTMLDGTPRFVSFSVSGVPTNVSSSFSTTSCSPSCSTILTFNANSNSSPGTYPITVTAKGGRVQRRTSFNLTILQPTVSTVATPTITPSGGSFTGTISVGLQDATSGASIYYTTDGSAPNQSSTLYTGAITLTNSAVVKAKAFKSGYNSSSEASASFTVNQPFNFSLSNSGDKSATAGSSVTNSISATLVSGTTQPVTFSASGLPSGATASFSPNSCSPSCSSTLTITTSASTPGGNYTVTVAGNGGEVTKTTSFNLGVNSPNAATPTINPNSGTYTGSVSVTLQSSTAGAAIYYTTNGSTPSQSSTLYTGTMTLTNSAVVKAKAFKSGYNSSGEASASFTVNQLFNFSLSNSGDKSATAGSSVTNSISATLVSGSAQPVTFSASGLPSGATASFSPNSCSPSCSSTLTISTSSSTPAGSSSITVTASGGGVTKTTTFNLGVGLPTVATPTISPNGGTYTGSVPVSLQTSTAGASIYYTTNGSTPTQSSTLYTGAMTLTNSSVVKAKAFKSGYNASSEASATFTIVSAPKLTVTWQDNSNNEDNFEVERKTGTNGSYVRIVTLAANNNSYADAGVISGATYCYRVRAANSSAVSGYSNEACAMVP